MTTTITVIISIISTLAANQWIIPLIAKAIDNIRDRKYNKNKQLLDLDKDSILVKEDSNNVYENQINFFVTQIDVLQKQLVEKQKDIDSFTKQLNELRSQIIELQTKIFDNKIKISKLTNLCCNNTDCQYRVKCDCKE